MNEASNPVARTYHAVKLEWTTDQRDWYRNVYLNSPHWKELRQRKLAEKPNCELCGGTATDIHHVKYKSIFDVELHDLVSVCRPCHDGIHAAFHVQRRKRPQHLQAIHSGPYTYRTPGSDLARALLMVFGEHCFICDRELHEDDAYHLKIRQKTHWRQKGVPVCRFCADSAMTKSQEYLARATLNDVSEDRWKEIWAAVNATEPQ